MAIIKIFDSVGVKTVVLMGNLEEQPYDEQIDDDMDDIINQMAEETEDGF